MCSCAVMSLSADDLAGLMSSEIRRDGSGASLIVCWVISDVSFVVFTTSPHRKQARGECVTIATLLASSWTVRNNALDYGTPLQVLSSLGPVSRIC